MSEYITMPQADQRDLTLAQSPAARWMADPLSADAMDDDVVVTSSRRLVRLAIAAVDVGARFERERIGHDAAAWMLAPRSAFDGRPAIEACQEQRGYLRSVVMHGLSLGLDADPADLDDLLDDEDDGGAEPAAPGPTAARTEAHPRLLTAWCDESDGPKPAIHFCAMVTSDPQAFAHRLVERFGPRAAGAAEIEEGFDPTTARATAFISDALRDTLVLAAASPSSPFATGLDVVVEQRFTA